MTYAKFSKLLSVISFVLPVVHVGLHKCYMNIDETVSETAVMHFIARKKYKAQIYTKQQQSAVISTKKMSCCSIRITWTFEPRVTCKNTTTKTMKII